MFYLDTTYYDESGDQITTGPGYMFCRQRREDVEDHVIVQFTEDKFVVIILEGGYKEDCLYYVECVDGKIDIFISETGG